MLLTTKDDVPCRSRFVRYTIFVCFAIEKVLKNSLDEIRKIRYCSLIGIFEVFFTDMMFHKFSTLFAFIVVVTAGCNCQNGGTQPVNPFAQNRQTIPPPATFSSQDSYLGQTPGTYIPQTPATTYPPSAPESSVGAADTTVSNSEKATLFSAAETESGWSAVETASTSHTAFQAMEAKANSGSTADMSESLIVGTSQVVTTISEDSPPATTPAEQQLLYSGGYTE